MKCVTATPQYLKQTNIGHCNLVTLTTETVYETDRVGHKSETKLLPKDAKGLNR